MNKKRILIMAGGTGGHVFPALAIAEALREKGHDVTWLGTQQGIEARIIPQAGFTLRFITIGGVRGKGFLQTLLSPFKIGIATFQAFKIIRALKPDIVIGLGGFASGPGGIAAFMQRIPLFIHEQNAIPGMTNWMLAHVAKKIMQAFPNTFPPRYKPILTGNPVRARILQLPSPEIRFRERHGPLRILLLGGSGGALTLNQTLPDTLALLPHTSYDVWHQTGITHLTSTQQRYAELGITHIKIDAFITDMAEAYGWADLVICRAGALTIAELAAAGVASILIPYPFAVDDHQTKNALFLVEKGAAILLPQSQLTAHRLAQIIQTTSRAQLIEKAKSAYQLRIVDAAEQVISTCEISNYNTSSRA